MYSYFRGYRYSILVTFVVNVVKEDQRPGHRNDTTITIPPGHVARLY